MLTRLVPDIARTAQLVTEITVACREQDIGAEQINQAIQQLDKVTQQNASASEEMSATSEQLAAQSEQLQSSIAYFRVGASAAAPTSQRRDAAPRRTPLPVTEKAMKPAASWQQRQSAKRPKRNGFALDLASNGADNRDAEFERM